MRIRIALRNVLRNKARTALSVLTISGAASGVILFHGFSDNILGRLQANTIDGRYNHIQVASEAYWNLAPGNRKGQLIAGHQELSRRLAALPGVTMVSGRLGFYGLLSTGEDTVSAEGIGYDPAVELHYQRHLRILEGRALAPGARNELIVGSGLRKTLGLRIGQSATALAYTLDGVVNAIDFEVVGVFQLGVTEVDNHVFMLPVATAQKLLDTEGVEKLTLRLQATEATAGALPEVEKLAREANPAYRARSWYELADLYRQTEAFFKTQNRVIELILLSLVLLGIMNTIGMTVYERTGEIGTIRALGETRRSVLLQFTLEGALLGALGVLMGFATGTVLSYVISGMKLTMVLPASSYPVPIEIKRVAGAYVEAALIGGLASVAATWGPALRASKMTIVEALRKNI